MRTDIQQQIDKKSDEVIAAVDAATKPHPFGHAFLWGYVSVPFKNGKLKEYRTCLGGVCCENLNEAVNITNSIVGVRGVWYNLD